MRFRDCFTLDVAPRTKEAPSFSEVLRLLLFDAGYRAVAYYRVACFLKRHRLLRRWGRLLSTLILTRLTRIPGVEFRITEEIGAGLRIPHPHNIGIGTGAKVGRGVTIYSGVSIAARIQRAIDETKEVERRYPTIGDGVTLFSGSIVIGPVEIGENSVVGANALVNRSFGPNSVVAGCPARLIRTRKQKVEASENS
jgi:serine O-acetyltransferase